MLVKVNSVAVYGISTVDVAVEVNVADRGFPCFEIVGLPTKAVAESKERVRTAIINSGFDFPAKRITVNLAPANLPKEGTFYDLPIAVGILSATNKLKLPNNALFMGELSLDGSVRPTKGIFLAGLHAKENKFDAIFAPKSSESALLSRDTDIIVITENLSKLFEQLKLIGSSGYINDSKIKETLLSKHPQTVSGSKECKNKQQPENNDFGYILGQEKAKRALEIAAAGGHNVLFTGVPGSGKTMLAKAFTSILPPLTDEEYIEVCKIYSAVGELSFNNDNVLLQAFYDRKRPFRAPHHTCSYAGFVGGGSIPKPGELSLSNNGVLFMDEFAEFPRNIIETLRQPLENGSITVSRSKATVTFPSNFILLAATNPCPCGYYGSKFKACKCSKYQIDRYKSKISGPILDRIDLFVNLEPVEIEKLTKFRDAGGGESSKTRENVVMARKTQGFRFRNNNGKVNSTVNNKDMGKYCVLNPESMKILNLAAGKFNMSARSYFKIIKVSRTIADLDSCKDIKEKHVLEALQFRSA